MILIFVCYLRPEEALFETFQLVPPTHQCRSWTLWLHPMESGIPGKTQLFDEHVIIDDIARGAWLATVIAKMVTERMQEAGARSPFWRHSHQQFLEGFGSR